MPKRHPINHWHLETLAGHPDASYFLLMCPDLASISTGLAELQGETKRFIWTYIHQKAFDRCKELIMSNQILQPINHESGKLIYLITNAS